MCTEVHAGARRITTQGELAALLGCALDALTKHSCPAYPREAYAAEICLCPVDVIATLERHGWAGRCRHGDVQAWKA